MIDSGSSLIANQFFAVSCFISTDLKSVWLDNAGILIPILDMISIILVPCTLIPSGQSRSFVVDICMGQQIKYLTQPFATYLIALASLVYIGIFVSKSILSLITKNYRT